MYKNQSNSGQRPQNSGSTHGRYGQRPQSRFNNQNRSSGGYRPNRRPKHRTSNRGPVGENISHARMINKATNTEEVEHFIPEHKFSDFQIDETLKGGIISKGYISPTPIQDRSIPHILKGQDIVGIANTGTGKTAAFLIPLIHKVLSNPAKEQVLIIVPTRELAIQIDQEFKE